MVAPLLIAGASAGLGLLAGSGGKVFDKVVGSDTAVTTNDQRQTDNSKKSQKTITNTSSLVDNRSLILTLNSPNSTTKKSDNASATPSVTNTSALTTPTQFGNPSNTPLVNSPQSEGVDLQRLIILGALAGGGILVVNNLTKGGKK